MSNLLLRHSSPLLPCISRTASVGSLFAFVSKRAFEEDLINLRPRSINFNASVCESAAHQRFDHYMELQRSDSQ